MRSSIARGVTRDSEAARHKLSPVKIHEMVLCPLHKSLEEQASQDNRVRHLIEME